MFSAARVGGGKEINMPNCLLKEELSTPVRYSTDVCVAGGGIAGIAAAISAARAARRSGKEANVMLLERGYMLGGLATAGIITIYLPLCDGYGKQVSFGLAEELLRLSIEYGAEDRYPEKWLEGKQSTHEDDRFEVQYNAQLFAISAEKLLLDEGVKILYGVSVVNTVLDDGRITHVIIEGKSGREAISVNTVVDTTGDADVCKLAGAETATFTPGNRLSAWHYTYGGGKYQLNMYGVIGTPTANEYVKHAIKRRFEGLDTEEISEFTCIAHETVIDSILEKRKTVPDTVPVTMFTTPQLRMTRRIVGEYTQHDTEIYKAYDDSVGAFSDWRIRGPVYELPFRTLYSGKVKNLITAGRCISVTDDMWDITRVIPVCAVSGEAAGAAAAMFDDFKVADVARLQEYLESAGVVLHPERNEKWNNQ